MKSLSQWNSCSGSYPRIYALEKLEAIVDIDEIQ